MTIDRAALLDAVRVAHEAQAETARRGRSGPREVGGADLHAAVDAAYQAGVTVGKIADTLGQSQPAVTRKYGPFSKFGHERPAGSPIDAAAALAILKEAVDVADVAKTDEALLSAIAAARQGKVTWREIAEVLGRSQPNVVQQYAPQLKVSTRVQPAPRKQVKQVKLTPEQRAEITRRAQADESISKLAAEFGASESHVRRLRRQPPVS